MLFAKMIEATVNFMVKSSWNYAKIFHKYEIGKILDKKGSQYYIMPDYAKFFKVMLVRLKADTKKMEKVPKDLKYDALQVTRMKSRRDSQLFTLYLVILAWTKSAQKILKIISLFWISIKMEDYRLPKIANQCYRCNKFNRIARYCKLKPVCCICSEEHETAQEKCSRNKSPPPVWANCKKFHISSYKGCKNYHHQAHLCSSGYEKPERMQDMLSHCTESAAELQE